VVRSVDSSKCFPAKIYKMQLFPSHDTTFMAEEGPQDSVTLAELAYYAHSENQQFIGKGSIKNVNAPPWHASFADVTVDTETGQITVNKMAGVHDVGRVINPDYVEGQITGGALQGVGYAVSEMLTYNQSNGQQWVTDIHQYNQPTALSAPPIDALMVEEDCPSGPFGAKGCGETPCVCPAAAIVNAVCNALGINPKEVHVPMTPDHVLAMIQEQA